MALRIILTDDDPALKKVCRPVEQINDRILMLLDDMEETMRHADGVGLAAPQVGILRRVVVIDVGEGLIELINPKIIQKEGEQFESEGCLSYPGVTGKVRRPAKVTVKYLNRDGEVCEMSGEDLLARAFCHEIDHLNGITIPEIIEEFDEDEEEEAE
ncbi:MAG: peptide deformylase [Christensenellales bacterium]|jgi:peptide deformylase